MQNSLQFVPTYIRGYAGRNIRTPYVATYPICRWVHTYPICSYLPHMYLGGYIHTFKMGRKAVKILAQFRFKIVLIWISSLKTTTTTMMSDLGSCESFSSLTSYHFLAGPVWPDLTKFLSGCKKIEVFGNFWRLNSVLYKIITCFGNFFVFLAKFSMLQMAKYWKNNLIIGTHWSAPPLLHFR